MTNRIAVYLGLVLAIAIGADLLFDGGHALMFLSRKFVNLVEWVAFWR